MLRATLTLNWLMHVGVVLIRVKKKKSKIAIFSLNGLWSTQLKVSTSTRTAWGGIAGFVRWLELWIPPHWLSVINCVAVHGWRVFSLTPCTVGSMVLLHYLRAHKRPILILYFLMADSTTDSIFLAVRVGKIQPDINLSSNLILLPFFISLCGFL